MDDLLAALRRAHPELERVREAAEEPVYLVGGAVRDLLLERPRADVDLVVEGDAAALAARLGGAEVEHERFGTVKVELEGHEVDVASARSEAYAEPGALPTVESGASIEEDLRRRDFTINALAIPLGEPSLIDPFGGRADLERGQLRVLHSRSFLDDPTRAIRAARYAARFGFGLEPETERLLREANLGTVSVDRRRGELLRLAAEASAPHGFALLADWGLVELREEGIELAELVLELLASEPWTGTAEAGEAVLAAALGPPGAEVELAGAAEPVSPSAAVELAGGHSALELLLARGLGAEWLDRYLEEWSRVSLEIDGGDLLEAGIPQGPALGRGLAAALRAKLDGEIAGREQELQVALEAARQG
jgi:tRNA nucleotidyltransferase (CCA-adding enzyme)